MRDVLRPPSPTFLRRYALAALLFFTVPGAASATEVAPVFGPPEALNSTAATDSQTPEAYPHIATDGDGSWVAVWQAGAQGLPLGGDQDIVASVSRDDGLTWSPPVPLNADPHTDRVSDARPRIATNRGGTWVTVWQADNQKIAAARSTDNGATWSPAIVIANRPGANYAADVVASGSTWIATWTGTRAQTNEEEIFFSRSIDNGASWSSPEPLNSDASTDTRYDSRPRLATDEGGNWVAVWEATANGVTRDGVDVWFARSDDNGQHWSNPLPLRPNPGPDPRHDSEPVIANVGSGKWAVAWSSTTPSSGAVGNDGDIVVSRSLDGGDSWSAPTAVNTDAAADSRPDRVPAIAADGDHVVVAWMRELGLIAVSSSHDGGSTWTPPQPLSDEGSAGRQDRDPQLAIAGDTWVATWAAANVIVARSTNAGEFWSPPAMINPDANDVTTSDYGVDLAFGQAGTAIAVWASRTSLADNFNDISVARSTNSGQVWSLPASLLGVLAGTTSTVGVPRVATDGGGHWMVTWSYRDSPTESDEDLVYTRSADNGETWTFPTFLNPGADNDLGDDLEPSVASNGLGTWIATWVSNNTIGGIPSVGFRVVETRSLDDGASWSAPETISTDVAFDARTPRTLAAGSTWITVWGQRSMLAGDYDIYFARSMDNGSTWSAPAPVDPGAADDSGFDYFPDLASDGQNTWVSVWRSDDSLRGTIGTDNDILFSRSSDGGVTWSPAALLNSYGDSDLLNDQNPQIATDATGTWVAIWETSSNLVSGGDVYVARSFDNGESWTPATPLQTGQDAGQRPEGSRIATDRAGVWIAAWSSTDSLGSTIGDDADILYARSVPPPTACLNFEMDAAGFTTSGLWHRATMCGAELPEHTLFSAFYYGQDGSCTYDTGGRNEGSLTSPSIDLRGLATASVLFRHLLIKENTAFDSATLEIAVDEGDFELLAGPYASGAKEFRDESVDLTPYTGHQVQIRWHFDTSDGFNNGFLGWLVDDVSVVSDGACLLPTRTPTPSATATVTATPTITATPADTPSDTPTSTDTPTPVPTDTPQPTLTGTATVTTTATAAATHTSVPSCPGDCAGDGAVTINDLVLAVNVALGGAPVSECSAADRDGNGQVEINELIAAVGAALVGC